MNAQDETTLDEYEWPTCLACGRNLWDDELGRYCCRLCETATRTRLNQLPGLFARLNKTTALMPGSRKTGGSAPSGSRTPPLPLRLDVLSLIAPKGGVAEKLQNIEDAWRKALGRRIGTWAGSPTEAVPTHAQFLVINLEKACETYESIGQDIDNIRRLHSQCTAILEQKPRIGNVKIGICPTVLEGQHCGEQLYASGRSFKTACQTCGTVWEGEHEWRQLRAAQQEVLAELAGAAA